jgi:hypothetical protein
MSEEAKKRTWRLVDWLSWGALAAALLDAGLKWIVDYDVPVSAAVLAAIGMVIRVLRAMCFGGGTTNVTALFAALGIGLGGMMGAIPEPENRVVYETSGAAPVDVTPDVFEVIDPEVLPEPEPDPDGESIPEQELRS